MDIRIHTPHIFIDVHNTYTHAYIIMRVYIIKICMYISIRTLTRSRSWEHIV